MPSNVWGHLSLALAFLSRFPTKQTASAQNLAAALPYFALASLILGLGLTLPTASIAKLLASHLKLDLLVYLLAAWLWLALEVYLTRALHWDGLADLTDALGSNQSGPKFWLIIKDSRLGTFGALGLILVLFGQFLAITAHIAAQNYVILILAPVFARQAPFWLAKNCPASQNSSLGALFSASVAQNKALNAQASIIFVALPLLLLGFVHLFQILLLLLSQILIIQRLKKIALQNGGLSGDFCGAAIELSQLNFLLLTL